MARHDHRNHARLSALLAGAALLLTLPGCLVEESRDAAFEPAAAGEASKKSPCEAVRFDTWFGPTRTPLEAQQSCEALLSDRCAALGCEADLGTIDVAGYGGETDKNWYCRGETVDYSSELPKYLGACRAPGDVPEDGPSISPAGFIGRERLCGEHFPACPAASHCSVDRGPVGRCIPGSVRPRAGR